MYVEHLFILHPSTDLEFAVPAISYLLPPSGLFPNPQHIVRQPGYKSCIYNRDCTGITIIKYTNLFTFLHLTGHVAQWDKPLLVSCSVNNFIKKCINYNCIASVRMNLCALATPVLYFWWLGPAHWLYNPTKLLILVQEYINAHVYPEIL